MYFLYVGFEPRHREFYQMVLHTNRLFDIAVDTRAGLSLWSALGPSGGGPVRDISAGRFCRRELEKILFIKI